jgi:hypothetical protein
MLESYNSYIVSHVRGCFWSLLLLRNVLAVNTSSLDKLSSIVDQARHTQKLLDLNIEDYFKPGSPVEPVVKIESLAHVSRPEFFQAIKKSLTKYIKVSGVIGRYPKAD